MSLLRIHSNRDLPENFFSAPPGSERKTSIRPFPDAARKGRIFKVPEAFITLLKDPPPLRVALEFAPAGGVGEVGVDPGGPAGIGDFKTSGSVPGFGFTPVSLAGRATWGALIQGAVITACGG